MSTYRITVAGVIDSCWTDYFSGIAFEYGPSGITHIRAEVADQSALYGLLCRARDLNLTLVSVQLLDPVDRMPVECHDCPFRAQKKESE